MNEIFAKIEEVKKTLAPLQITIKEIHKKIIPFLTYINIEKNIENMGLIIHEIFFKVFSEILIKDEGFDKKMIEKNWDKIGIFLKERWSASLMNDNRKERLEQIYKAMDVGAYIAVCRATYPEVECLLREISYKDKDFNSLYNNPATTKESKNGLLRQKLKTIKDNPFEHFGINEYTQLNENNLFTIYFLEELKKSFGRYDEESENNIANNFTRENKKNRHFHCHGFSNEADFIDALNALLILDMAMHIITLQNIHDQN